MSEKIVINSSIEAKESPMLRSVKPKAVAGLSEAEIIERNTIGEIEEEEKNEDKKESNTD